MLTILATRNGFLPEGMAYSGSISVIALSFILEAEIVVHAISKGKRVKNNDNII